MLLLLVVLLPGRRAASVDALELERNARCAGVNWSSGVGPLGSVVMGATVEKGTERDAVLVMVLRDVVEPADEMVVAAGVVVVVGVAVEGGVAAGIPTIWRNIAPRRCASSGDAAVSIHTRSGLSWT